MTKGEPPSPSCSNAHLFLVGKNSHGNSVVRDLEGLCGGFFIDRDQALKFIRLETGKRPAPAIMVHGVLELDLSARPNHLGSSNIQVSFARAA